MPILKRKSKTITVITKALSEAPLPHLGDTIPSTIVRPPPGEPRQMVYDARPKTGQNAPWS